MGKKKNGTDINLRVAITKTKCISSRKKLLKPNFISRGITSTANKL
jgi:hypothetical protein